MKELQVQESREVVALSLAVREYGMQQVERHPKWPLLSTLPLRLEATIPIAAFRVSDLLALRPGATVASDWPATEDVRLRVGAVQLGWAEFEVVEQRMAVRLTRLA